MQLIINLNFPFERFHGREFPPSPSRLFQALIAATHRGIYAKQNAELRDNALVWLENLAPPIIETCESVESGKGVTNYVPNNDNSFAHNKTAKSLQAFVLSGENEIRYVWQFPQSDENKRNAETVCKMVQLVTSLGHGQDAVFARGEILFDDSDETEKALNGRAVFRPKERLGSDWSAPTCGALAAYKRRYAEFLRTGLSHNIPVPSRQIDYVRNHTIDLICPYALFEMRELGDEDKFHSVDGRDLRQPAAMFRHAVFEFFKSQKGERFKSYYGEELIARKIFGHEPNGENALKKAVNAPHLAFVPIHNLYPDGRIRRVLLAGFDFENQIERELFDDVAKNLNGAEIKDQNESIARLIQVENHRENKFFKQFYGSSNRVWRSVTPIILSGFTRRGREPEKLIYRALNQIGIETEAIESVAVFRAPVVPKTFHVKDYCIEKDSYLNHTPRYHAEIIFNRPVRGVLVVGKGRHAGFGLMTPVR